MPRTRGVGTSPGRGPHLFGRHGWDRRNPAGHDCARRRCRGLSPVYDNFFNHRCRGTAAYRRPSRRRAGWTLTPCAPPSPQRSREVGARRLLQQPSQPTGTVPEPGRVGDPRPVGGRVRRDGGVRRDPTPPLYAGGPGFHRAMADRVRSELGSPSSPGLGREGMEPRGVQKRPCSSPANSPRRPDPGDLPGGRVRAGWATWGRSRTWRPPRRWARMAGRVLSELDDSRALLARPSSPTAISCRVREGSGCHLLAWLDFRATDLGRTRPPQLRQRAGVALSSGPHYGAVAWDGLRPTNFATGPEILARCKPQVVADRVRGVGAGCRSADPGRSADLSTHACVGPGCRPARRLVCRPTQQVLGQVTVSGRPLDGLLQTAPTTLFLWSG